MIVPEYWAEAKERVVVDGKARTYKRFGWSDESEEEALENARERVAEAAQRARRGEKMRLSDPKVSYNGAEGLPIREEIISRRGDSVITRNSYGAACLNTPDVMFADVDVKRSSYATFGWAVFVLFVVAAFWVREACNCNGAIYFWALIIAGIMASAALGSLIHRATSIFRTNPFDTALAKIEKFGERNSTWVLRVYRTPNGYRVLAMHETFDPSGDKAQGFMKAIGGDPLYALMCRNQKCFRARLSPKPWRIGIQEHLRPRPGVWPIAENRMSDRRRWVRNYESEASGYAACRFVKTIGKRRTSRKCEEVRRVHDDLCKADTDLPIA
jgi:hypothetical protein